jgi:hypothetical protein
MADFLRKVLPDHTAEHQPKTDAQKSTTQTETIHGNAETPQQQQ